VGDDSGTINSFEFNKRELGLEWKSTPLGKEISRVELSGSSYNSRDKIFYSGGTMIRGISKKGKEFWRLDSNLTETIKAFGVEESRLWTAGVYQFRFNNFRIIF
jgi:Bardet-Biedl syndrome 7 protein